MNPIPVICETPAITGDEKSLKHIKTPIAKATAFLRNKSGKNVTAPLQKASYLVKTNAAGVS